MSYGNKTRGSLFTLLELVIVLAIVLFLVQRGIVSYFKPSVNQGAVEAARSAGINTSTYGSVIASTRDKLGDIANKRSSDMDAAFGDTSR